MMLYQHKKSNRLPFIFFSVLAIILPIILPIIKLSYVVGSIGSFFSLKNCFIPLSGAFGGIPGTLAMSIARICHILYSTEELSLRMSAFYLPGLCASLYLATTSIAIRLLLPLACFILFCIHPIGGTAFMYALLWLIPVTLYFIPSKSVFFNALGSTFTAHAIGSVIWLYTTPMTAATWLALIPIALTERLFFAIGMTMAYHAITACASQLSIQLPTQLSAKLQKNMLTESI